MLRNGSFSWHAREGSTDHRCCGPGQHRRHVFIGVSSCLDGETVAGISSPLRAYFAIVELIGMGLTQGGGLLTLIPFLQLNGIPMNAGRHRPARFRSYWPVFIIRCSSIAMGVGDSAPPGLVAIIGELWTESSSLLFGIEESGIPSVSLETRPQYQTRGLVC